MFIAAPFIIGETWMQPKCPLTDEWKKKMWYIYTMEYYSDTFKKSEIKPFKATWMDLEIIMLSEVRQRKTNVISFISSVQFLSYVQLFAAPWNVACQASLSITNSGSLLKLMSIKSVMPSNHLILCHPLLLPPSHFPSIKVSSNESVLQIRWPKY